MAKEANLWTAATDSTLHPQCASQDQMPSPAKSSARKIPVDPKSYNSNWRFFTGAYDSTLPSNNVNLFFGSQSKNAAFDTGVTYDRGPAGLMTGPELTVGHFNTATRSRGTADHIFRGLIDEIRVYCSKTDGSGALSAKKIISIQKAPASATTRPAP